MFGDQKVLSLVTNRVQMLYKTVSEPPLGLTDVEEATSEAEDAVDHVDGCAGEPLSNVEGLFGALKFTWAISDASFSFLDLSVSTSKPTSHSHNYIDYTSSHPLSCKNAIPYSQFLCLSRVCSQDGAFHSHTSQMSSYFKDHNIPPSVVENALNCISCVPRISALTSPHPNKYKDRVPLVLKYHPTNLHIQRIILRHFCHLQSDRTTK
eukprot:g19755.t1